MTLRLDADPAAPSHHPAVPEASPNVSATSAVGQQPWQILSHEIRPAQDRVPPALAKAYPMMDLVTREFRFIGRKRFDPCKWLEQETQCAEA